MLPRLRLAALLVLGACGERARTDAPPERLTLSGADVAVEVTTRPYALKVRDREGRDVLATLPAGTGDGYAAFGWTAGTTEWETVVSPGYFRMSAALEPWRDAWEVVSSSATADTLEVVLARPGAAAGEPTARVRHVVRPGALRVEVTVEGTAPRAVATAFATPADERFLGFGERFNRTDQRGLDVYSWAEEGGLGTGEGDLASEDNPFPNGQVMSYYPVPFFVSTRGYGFWLDTTWRSEFNLATRRPDAWRAWHLGPTLAYEVYLPSAGDPRPWPYQLIDRFTEATGRPMLPPAWTFGPRRRVGRGSRVGEVSEIQAMRDEDLAITGVDDALHFLPKGSHVGIETELAAWTADARRLGYHVNGYYNAYLARTEENPLRAEVERGLANGWFLETASGEPSVVWLISGQLLDILTVDFTSPDATAWFQGMLDWALDLGYSGWMYDFGEYVHPDVLSSTGLTGEELHNLFPVLYQKAAYEHLERVRPGQWLTFVRSGYTGASRWSPMVWMGDPAASFEDSDGLPSMVRGALNLGLSGVPHTGGDIGGFHCNADGVMAADGELVARWIQQGSMTSNMQDQNACASSLTGGTKASIWNAPEARQAWRDYARLHTRLFPYLYTLAHEATRTGAPTVRHLFLEHPDRPDLAAVDDAHYLGRGLLVAPVVARGARQRALELPPGKWLDWRDRELVEGGGPVTLDAPLDKLPLLLRDGHLVPLLDPTIDTLAEESNADVIGPADVAGVYDVVGLVSRATGRATFELWDGGRLGVTWHRELGLAELRAAGAQVEELAPGLLRLTATGPLAAGGLTLESTVARTIRWEIFLAP